MSDHFTENKPKQPSHIAYNVVDGKDNKHHWQKIGAAWPTKDGGLSVKVNAVPLNGEIQLRSREALEKMREQRQQKQQQKQQHTQQPSHTH